MRADETCSLDPPRTDLERKFQCKYFNWDAVLENTCWKVVNRYREGKKHNTMCIIKYVVTVSN